MTMFRKMMGVSIPQDFIAAYNFNGNTNDRSANALNGSLVGGATITNDRLNVTANSQYMSVNDSDLLSFGSGAFSFSFKVLITTVGSDLLNWIVNKRSDLSTINNARAEYQCYFENRKFTFLLWDSSKTVASYIACQSDFQFLLNTEYKIQVTFSGGVGNNFKIYSNGQLITHTYLTSGSYTQMRNTTAQVRFGLIGWGTVYPTLGYLDNFYIYNRELTASECTLLANE